MMIQDDFSELDEDIELIENGRLRSTVPSEWMPHGSTMQERPHIMSRGSGVQKPRLSTSTGQGRNSSYQLNRCQTTSHILNYHIDPECHSTHDLSYNYSQTLSTTQKMT